MPGNLPSGTEKERQFDARSRAAGGNTAQEERSYPGEDRTGSRIQHTGAGGSGGAVLASVPARRGRLGGTATTTTRDSRRGTGNGGNGFARASRVLFFLGEAAGGALAVLPGLVLLLCAGETASGGAPPRHSHATGGSQPAHGPRRTARPAQKLPQASWPRRKKTRPHRHRRKCPAKLRGRRYVAHGTSHQDPAKRAAGGDGRQPRREHRHLQQS